MDGDRHDSPSTRRRTPGWSRALAWMGLGAGITVAMLTGVVMLALSALEQRPELAADWIADYLGREVRLESIEIAWRDRAPLLRLRGLEVGSRDGDNLALDAAEVRVDTLGSLRALTLLPSSVTLRGANINVERAADGSITVAGIGVSRGAGMPEASIDRALGGALAALPASADLRLEDAAVTLRGMGGADGVVVLQPINLGLSHSGDRLRLSGSVSSPRAPDTPARFTLHWPRAAANPLHAAELTLSAREFPLAALPAGLRDERFDAQLSLELDGTIARGRVQKLRGDISITNPELAPAPGALAGFERIHSPVEFMRDDGGWRLDLLRLEARTPHGTWSAGSASITRRTGDTADSSYELHLDSAPVAGLLPMLRHVQVPGAAAQRVLAALTAEGRIEDLHVVLDASSGDVRIDSVTLEKLRLDDPRGRFATGPLRARLALGADHGRLDLMPLSVSISPDDAAAALAFAAGGELSWQRGDDGGVVFATTGLNLVDGVSRMRITGSAGIPGRAEPGVVLDMEVRSGALEVATVKRYLALVPHAPTLRQWIDGAIEGGTLHDLIVRADGAVASAGDLADALHIEAAFHGTSLRYLGDWPRLEGLNGTLSLDGFAFGFTLADGSVTGARIVSATGSIEDVTAKRTVLVVRGRAAGATAHGSAFLAATPMGPRFTGLLDQLRADGSAALDLRLQIPLYGAQPRVNGTLTLRDNVLRVPALRSALTSVSGSINFDRGGLGQGTLKAMYVDREIEARIDGTLENHERTRLSIRGRTDPKGLVRILHDVGAIDSDDIDALPMLSRLAGEAAGQVVMDIPGGRRLERDGIALSVSSDLAGMALNLPAPLGKSRAQRRELMVRTRLARKGERTFAVRYGEQTRAVLRAAPDREGFRFDRGELRFGGEAAVMPASKGLHVLGTLDTLSVDDWVAFVASTGAERKPAGAQRAMTSVRTVDVNARHLDVLASGFEDVRLRMSPRDGSAWQIAVAGDTLDGTIRIPLPVGRAAIDASFEHLHVRRASGARVPAGAGTLAPADLPPARLVVRNLRYNDVDLGIAKLTLTPHGDGLRIDELVAIHDDFEVRGSGSWSQRSNGTASQLDLRIHGADFGRLTTAFGYGESGVEGGAVEIALQAEWQGSPFDLSLDRVTGVLHFRASAGRLREVERGASGRVFGLLNVTILPRRLLRLDFSDLFDEGMGYERLEGSFRLIDGNAHTDNVRMETENAHVELRGRVGLVAEDYEQTMTVTPKLSASLPLAPLWLAEKFLNRKLIDSAFAYRYYISGPWADPVIEREAVEAEPAEAG